MKFLRYADLNPREASNEEIAGPLWFWHPRQIKAVKHERRRRLQFDLDDVDAPIVFDE